MTQELRFEVNGIPAPQGSKSGFVVAGKQGSKSGFVVAGKVSMKESSDKVKPWRQDVVAAAVGAAEAQGWVVPSGPLYLDVTFRFHRPKGHYGTGRNADRMKDSAPYWHSTVPDCSKLVRSTEDALVTAGVIVDDRCIAVISATKVYCGRGEPSGATVIIREVTTNGVHVAPL